MNVVVNIPNFYDSNESSVTGEFIGKVEYKTIYNQYGSTFVSEPLDLIVNKKYRGLTSSYFTDYNNGDIGNVTDSTIINRNTILDLNNQERFRSIAMNSSGSLYPTDQRYDPYYNNTKVILNFATLTNQAFTNLSVLSSGSFQLNDGPTPNTSSFIANSIQVLVVAGGGGGGSDMGGGGGGGGVIYNSAYTATSGSVINVTVGNGGSGAPAGVGQVRGTNGNNSLFGNLIAIGGGGGASCHDRSTSPAGNGGSGGGASGGGTLPSGGQGGGGYGGGIRGTGSLGQGNDGGTGLYAWYPGGGGGAGGVGASGPNIPHGGPGLLFSLMSPYYFGGGGGGSAYSVSPGGNGGIGGGGGGAIGVTVGGEGLNNGLPGGGGGINSWANTPGGNAGANTGGGGGGGSHYNSNNYGGNGGSGIVIVRYYGSQKATGGTVTTVNGNTIHTFTSGTATLSFYATPSTLPSVVSYGYFNGSGSFLRISGSSLLNIGSNNSPFTVEYDFYTNSSSKYQTILSRGGGTANYNTSSGLAYNSGISSSKVIWEYRANNTSRYLLTGSTNIINNNWYYYAVTYDGNITRLYLNGVLENSVIGSVYSYPSTLLSSLKSSFIGRLVKTTNRDFSGYLDRFRITTGVARYTTSTYTPQTSSYQTATGFLSGSYYRNSNILNIRFVTGSISASNLILPTGTSEFTASQDLLVTNIVGAVNNGYINTISSGSSKTIRRLDGITNQTDFTGDEYSNVSFTTKGSVDKTYVMSTDVEFFTKVSEFVPLINPSIVYEVDFNTMLNVQIDNTATIVALYDAPVGFYISSDKLNLVGYVNFTEQITMRVKLSNSVTYNVIIKPIFMRSKYTYTI